MAMTEMVMEYIEQAVQRRHVRGEYSDMYGFRPSEVTLGAEVMASMLAECSSSVRGLEIGPDNAQICGIPVEVDYEDPCRISIDGVEYAYVL